MVRDSLSLSKHKVEDKAHDGEDESQTSQQVNANDQGQVIR